MIKLKEKQIEKAKEIERAAMEGMDQFPVDRGDEKRRFRNIMEELREKGLLTEEEEREIFGEGGHLEKEKMPLRVQGEYREAPDLHRNTFGRKVFRTAAAIAVVCVGIFAVCMTSEGNRRNVMDAVSGLMGNDARVRVNTDEGEKIRVASEDEARMEIQNKLGIQMPVMLYKPKAMMFEGYELYPDRDIGLMHYLFNGNRIIVQVIADELAKKGTSTLDSASVEMKKILNGEVTAKIYIEENGGNIPPSISAQWKYDGVYYQLIGNMEEETMSNILEKIRY